MWLNGLFPFSTVHVCRGEVPQSHSCASSPWTAEPGAGPCARDRDIKPNSVAITDSERIFLKGQRTVGQWKLRAMR